MEDSKAFDRLRLMYDICLVDGLTFEELQSYRNIGYCMMREADRELEKRKAKEDKP